MAERPGGRAGRDGAGERPPPDGSDDEDGERTAMASESVEKEFRKSVAAQIRLVAEGANRYRLSTPFMFDDGDHPIIILKREDAKWVLSDEGHIRMHLGDDLEAEDRDRGTRQGLVSNALARFQIEDCDG